MYVYLLILQVASVRAELVLIENYVNMQLSTSADLVQSYAACLLKQVTMLLKPPTVCPRPTYTQLMHSLVYFSCLFIHRLDMN